MDQKKKCVVCSRTIKLVQVSVKCKYCGQEFHYKCNTHKCTKNFREMNEMDKEHKDNIKRKYHQISHEVTGQCY